jgi:hypothetical protein
MGIKLSAGKNAKIGIKPAVVGKTYGTGFLYLTEMSSDSNLSFSRDVTEQEVYGSDAKVIGGVDSATFEATAFATATTGQVHKVVVGTPGSGYTSAPTVALAAPPVGGVQATAIAEVDLATGTVTGVFITNFGEGYTSAPSVTFTGGGGTSAAATASIGGITDGFLYDLLKAGDVQVEFSPNGGVTSGKQTKFTMDFSRESFNIEPPINGVVTIPFSGKAQNVVKTEW